MNKEIYILGVGHSTPVIIDMAIDCGFQVAGLYHFNSERNGEEDHGFKILGSFEDLLSQNIEGQNFALSMGDNHIRASLIEKILAKGGNIPTMIHPLAVVSRFATVSPVGVIIAAGCDIQADAVIESDVVMRSGALVGHTTHVGAHSFIASHSAIGAYISIGEYTFFGLGCICISSKVSSIGNEAVIGAGSVVNKDIPSKAVVVGNPAKVIKIKD